MKHLILGRALLALILGNGGCPGYTPSDATSESAANADGQLTLVQEQDPKVTRASTPPPRRPRCGPRGVHPTKNRCMNPGEWKVIWSRQIGPVRGFFN